MKRGKDIDKWFPLWIDKWLLGSTRYELIIKNNGDELDLRGIWMDLLTLSQKDDGWIRANETMPYDHRQLAGMFNVSTQHLKMTIEICLKVGKITEPLPGIYFITSMDCYKLSRSLKYTYVEDDGQNRPPAGQNCPIDKSILEDNKRPRPPRARARSEQLVDNPQLETNDQPPAAAPLNISPSAGAPPLPEDPKVRATFTNLPSISQAQFRAWANEFEGVSDRAACIRVWERICKIDQKITAGKLSKPQYNALNNIHSLLCKDYGK